MTSHTGLGSNVAVNGKAFALPFWYVTWTNVDTDATSGRVIRDEFATIDVTSEPADARFTGSAMVYYVWDPGAEDPHTFLYLDAYDASLEEFIPDTPWVEVATTPSWQLTQDPNAIDFTAIPYPGNPLSVAINDQGFVDTDAAIATGAGIKISARDLIEPSGKIIKTFSRWFVVRMESWDTIGVSFGFDPEHPRDASLGHNCILVLIAIYNEERFVLERPGNFHPVGVEIYEIEALRRRQGEISQQLATFAQQMTDQKERTATLTRRFDSATASLMALSARVEALQKHGHIAETVTRLEERSVAREQSTEEPTVVRRGFFARLFRRGS